MLFWLQSNNREMTGLIFFSSFLGVMMRWASKFFGLFLPFLKIHMNANYHQGHVNNKPFFFVFFFFLLLYDRLSHLPPWSNTSLAYVRITLCVLGQGKMSVQTSENKILSISFASWFFFFSRPSGSKSACLSCQPAFWPIYVMPGIKQA